MDTYLHNKFYLNIRKDIKDYNIKSLLIAISGGQDSLCLVKLIQDYKLRLKYNELLRVEYIYVDHKWQADSQKQIQHIINFIQSEKQSIFIYEMHSIVKSEVDARNARYNIIIDHALANKHQMILTAHTKTDCIETFFQQVMRGTSIEGATSLRKKRKIGPYLLLLRPLINFSRVEVNWFCRKYCLPIWSDITNYKYRMQRNRVRYELIPYMSRYFKINVEQKINSFLQTSSLDNEYIKQNSIKLYLKSIHSTNIALNCKIIKLQHTALQARVLQIFFYHNFNKTLDSHLVYHLIFKIQTKNEDGQMIIWCNLNLQMYQDWFFVS